MSIVPPASATLIWAFPTQFEVVRCFVWEHGPAGWIIAVMFGDETLAIETAPTRWAMEAGVDMVWRGLVSSGLGKTAAASKTLAAISAMSAPGGNARGKAPEICDEMSEPTSGQARVNEVPAGAAGADCADGATPSPTQSSSQSSGQRSMQSPRSRFAQFRRAEDRLWPHTPFRHPEPSFDIEPSNPPPRRRPH
jgi:hypothetical protein